MEKSSNKQLRHGSVYENISEIPLPILAYWPWH